MQNSPLNHCQILKFLKIPNLLLSLHYLYTLYIVFTHFNSVLVKYSSSLFFSLYSQIKWHSHLLDNTVGCIVCVEGSSRVFMTELSKPRMRIWFILKYLTTVSNVQWCLQHLPIIKPRQFSFNQIFGWYFKRIIVSYLFKTIHLFMIEYTVRYQCHFEMTESELHYSRAVVGLCKQSKFGACGCSGQWYNAAAGDVFPAALPRSSLHWKSLPHLFPHHIVQHNVTDRTLHSQLLILHLYMLAIKHQMPNFVLTWALSNYCIPLFLLDDQIV